MKSVTVQDLVERFSLEVLAGSHKLNAVIPKGRVHRPGLEFVGYFDFFSRMRMCRCSEAKKLLTCIRLAKKNATCTSAIS